MSNQPIFCFGEILWDCIPAGLFLGGAPLNVACHLAKLGRSACIASAVGQDFLGQEAARRAADCGVDLEYLHRDPELPTGVGLVTLDEKRNAAYEFPAPCAWDDIPIGGALKKAIASSDALIFGTLAFRLHHNRDRFKQLLEVDGPLICLDVNLREPYDDIELALKLANQSDLVKLNEEELGKMTDLPTARDVNGLVEQCGRLKIFTGVERICVTRGAQGALFWDRGETFTAAAPRVEVRDTVGAGDAFMAALVDALTRGVSTADALTAACERGALVASQDGAV